jgi:hypothetical protein
MMLINTEYFYIADRDISSTVQTERILECALQQSLPERATKFR